MSNKQDRMIRLARVLRYNRDRIDKALTLFNDKKRPLFYAVPFLLQINHPDFPGYIDDPEIIYGLVLYPYTKEIQHALLKIFPNQKKLIDDPREIWPKKRCIEALSLMGSIGTAAQSEKSDLDYWVCVDGETVKDVRWELLQKKLTLIELWVWSTHKLEVHFFLSDIERVRNNDFGAADGESAGSAQPTFLKNEYYSTNVMISGKVPFWWITPCNCSKEYYQQEYLALKKGNELNPNHFIDLGNVEKLEENEMFGAAIWQLTKAMDSPFKSVLKMAKLEVFLDNAQKRIPLCNILKGRVHKGVNSKKNSRYTDPYALMFDSIISYYEKNNPKFNELFKICLYIKSDCALSNQFTDNLTTFKQNMIFQYLQSWNWQQDTIENYDSVKNWEFQKVSVLGQQIHSFLIGCYRRLSTQIQGHEQLVNNEDMTVIGRKIVSFYSVKPGKIQYLKRAFETGLIQSDITITMELDLSFDTKQRWSAFRGRLNYPDTMHENPCFLKDSSDPVDLVLWCIFNRIIDKHPRFYLLQSHLTINVDDISELINDALMDFHPIRVSELSREKLLEPCQITHCLLVINFSSHKSVADVETVRVIYLTSWGELFSFAGIKSFTDIKHEFISQATLPFCRLFTPSRNKRKVLYKFVEQLVDFDFDKVGLEIKKKV